MTPFVYINSDTRHFDGINKSPISSNKPITLKIEKRQQPSNLERC